MSASELDSRNIAISMRKSVENLVISSQDAIGQSISQALNFSGVISQHSNTANAGTQENRSVSRSPSPSTRAHEYVPDINESTSKSLEVSGERSDSASVGGDVVTIRDPKEYFRQSSTPNPARNSDGAARSKKKSWYNSLYPTYKSKSEDFKRIFKDLPEEERLIVDYSCALQKEILVQGRLYASQSFLCFYSSIFGWETVLCLRWKDVTAITKEKTALVIPNAILVCTEGEKNFLTSISGRDKCYLMLFRIWQNALMDQPTSSQSIWQWVHTCYGEELGFNSEEEGYHQRDLYEDPALPSLAAALPPDLGEVSMAADSKDDGSTRSSHTRDSTPPPPVRNGRSRFTTEEAGDVLPTDMSDSSDSDRDKPHSAGAVEKCTIHHDWRQFLNQEFPFNIDQLFTMIFTNSKFNLEILALRNITDYVQAPWAGAGGQRCRQVSYTAGLTSGPMGPKEVHVTETQVMNKCSKPGVQYSIESKGENANIPYADYFTVDIHYCLQRINDHTTQLSLYGIVNYKKTMWPVVRSFLEKNAMGGVEEFVRILSNRLTDEARAVPPRPRRRRRTHASPAEAACAVKVFPSSCAAATPPAAPRPGSPRWLLLLLLALLALNAFLYYKLYVERTNGFDIDALQNRMSVGSGVGAAEWSRLLEQHSRRQRHQLAAWRHALDLSKLHLAQTEQALSKLLEMIKPALEKQSDTQTDHNEL